MRGKKKKREGAIIIGSLFITIVVILFLIVSVRHMKQEYFSLKKIELQMTAIEKANQLNFFFDEQQNKLHILTSMDTFKKVVMNPNDTESIVKASEQIKILKNSIPGISILNKDGKVIVGDIDLPGTDYSIQPYFKSSKKSAVFEIYYDKIRKANFVAVVGPIYDFNHSNIIGVLAYDIRLDKLNSLMKESVDNGADEVYLIDADGMLLSRSEYIDQDNKKGVLIQRVDSEGANECLADLKKYGKEDYVEDHIENIEKYKNYMGDLVFGAHAYVTIIHGCILAEQNADEMTQFSLFEGIKNLFDKKEVEEDED